MKTTWIIAADIAARGSCNLRTGSGWSRSKASPTPKGAKRIGDYLDKARTDQRYEQLVLVAPPKFLGALRKELGKEVGKLVADELPKDLSWFNERELERYFAKGSGRAP